MSFQFVNNPWHARSQACRVGGHALHDPRQRGVPSPTTAFHRSTVGLHHGRLRQRRLHHWRLRQRSLHHALGKHRGHPNLLLDVCEVVQHYRYSIANGRRGARAGRRGARIEGRLFIRCGKLFRERLNERPVKPQQQEKEIVSSRGRHSAPGFGELARVQFVKR